MKRPVKDSFSLLYDLPAKHYGSPVSYRMSEPLVVGDEEESAAELLLESLQEADNSCLGGNVQHRSRFITDDKGRFERDSPGNDRTLQFSAAELVWVSGCLFRLKPYKPEEPLQFFPNLPSGR